MSAYQIGDPSMFPSTTLTSGNITIWPEQGTLPAYPSHYYYWTVPESPRECSGDVHVFPCPHCEKCKCGAATVRRGKKKA